MGTRSLTRFIEDGKPIVCLYGQYDGYITGHGRELANVLRDGRMVNGLRGGTEKVFNGAGCLAAQVTAAFKDGPGGHYLYSPDSEDEEYTYDLEVRMTPGRFGPEPLPEIQVSVRAYGDTLFTGPHSEFVQWAFLEESDDEEDTEENR